MTNGVDGGRPAALRGALVAALATLLLHGALALWIAPREDFRKYTAAASLLRDGQLTDERQMDFSPLYLALAVAADALSPRPELALRALQLVLASAAVGLLYFLLRQRFPRWVTIIMAVVLALDRNLLVYEHVLEPEIALLAGLLLSLVLLEARGRATAVGAGIAAALCLGLRPNLLPVFLLAPVALWLAARGEKHWRRRALLFTLPVVAALALLAARSARLTGDPSTPAMNPGTVFFEGNNPLSRGTSAVYPPLVLALVTQGGDQPDSAHQHYRDVARAATGRPLSVAAVNRFWADRALAFLGDHPRYAFGQVIGKLRRAFHNYRWHDVPAAWRHDRRMPLPAPPFALLAALALVGMLTEARRWRLSLLFYALAASQLGVMLVFYVSARQRLVWLPALLFFAAAALTMQHRRRAVLLWSGALLLGLNGMLPTDLSRDEEHQRRGTLEAKERLATIARALPAEPAAWHTATAVEAMAAAPWAIEIMRPAFLSQEGGAIEARVGAALEARDDGSVPGRFDRAAFALRLGDPTAAAALFSALAAEDTVVYRRALEPSLPGFYLGRAAALQGGVEGATVHLEAALKGAPGDPFVLAELALLAPGSAHEAALFRYSSALDGRFLRGRAALVHGRWAQAKEDLGYVAARLPHLHRVWLHLAAALGELGEIEAGVQRYLAGLRIAVEPIQHDRQIVDLFLHWAASHPERPGTQLLSAQVLRQYGHFHDALALLEGLTAPPLLGDEIEAEITRLQRDLAAGPSSR